MNLKLKHLQQVHCFQKKHNNMMNMIFLYNVKVLFNDIFSVCSRDSENEKNLHICLIII